MDNENEKSKELTTSSDKFCVNCGAKVEQNQLYCSVCGNKVDTIAEKTKPDKKVLIIMGVVVGFLVIVICLNLFGGNNENETETTQVQQETEMEQETEIAETTENETEQTETEETYINQAYDLMLPIVEENFSSFRYEFEKQGDNALSLKVHLSRQAYESADYTTYQGLVDSVVYATKSCKELLETYGFDKISFTASVGDLTNENGDYYIIATNGQLLINTREYN